MNEQAGSNRDGRKRRSFTEAVAMFAPIVPLPGDAPRAPAAAPADAPDDDLPPATGPQPIPLPPRLRAAVLPGDALPAPVRTAPERPDDALPPVQGPQPIAIPPHPLASFPSPSQAIPEPAAGRTAEVPASPEPMDDAAFLRSIAPPSLSDMPGQAAAVAAGRVRPRRRGVWPWAALLALSVAGAAAVWVLLRAPEPQSAGPAAERALPAPADVAASPATTPAPPSPAGVAAEPASPSAPQALPEPAQTPMLEPTPMPAPPADIAAEPVLPSAPQRDAEPAPAPGQSGAPGPAALEPDAVATEPPPAALPTPNDEPDAAGPQTLLPIPPIPVPPLPIPPVPTLASPDRRVVIYRRPASSAAEAEAARVAAKLRPLAAQVETRTAAANFRLPTQRYFHAEDADAAQELATALRRPDAEWRVQGVLTQAPPLPPHSFQVWLPDR